MTQNLSERCLTTTQMQMHGSEFELYLQRFLFPSLALFGILGNALNLTVLLNRSMRSRANTFLAVLAIADIAFLSLLLPNALANYPLFTFNYYFRWFYLNTKVHLLSFANWSSGVAILCVIAVCTDRLIGIRHPLYVRSHIASYKIKLLIASIVVFPGLFTMYQHFAYECIVRSFCHGTQLYAKCLAVNQPQWFGNQSNPHSTAFQHFIDVSIFLNVVLLIIFPIILLTTLNVLLLCALRQRSQHLLIKGDAFAKPCVDNMKYHKTEQRVTLTVALIVTMFTVTNGPSAVIHLLQTVYEAPQKDMYNITLMCSALVVFGKACNFILFCLFSKHFRNRLFHLAQKKVHEKLETMSISALDRKRSAYNASRRFHKSSPVPVTAISTINGTINTTNNNRDDDSPRGSADFYVNPMDGGHKLSCEHKLSQIPLL